MASLFKRGFPLQESSTNMEVDNLRPFLERIASHIPAGFGPPEIDSLVAIADAMAVDEENEQEFTIIYDGRKSKLQVRFFIDDISEVDVYIVSPAGLAVRIDAEIKRTMGDEAD